MNAATTSLTPAIIAVSSVANSGNTAYFTTIDYTVTGTSGQSYYVNFYASTATGSPAALYLGSSPLLTLPSTNPPGSVSEDLSISFTSTIAVTAVTATESDPTDGTSPFASSVAPTSNAYLVTNSTDNAQGSFVGSLRTAIENTDFAGGIQTITFSSPLQITTTAALPAITQPVVIDGTTVPHFAFGSTMVEINGGGIGGVAGDGLTLGAGSDGSTIRGLDIVGFTSGAAIHVESNGDTIAENYVGVTTSGAKAQNQVGVLVNSVTGATVGGTAAGTANVIGFNTTAGVQIVGPSASFAAGALGRGQRHRHRPRRHAGMGQRHRRAGPQRVGQHDRRHDDRLEHAGCQRDRQQQHHGDRHRLRHGQRGQLQHLRGGQRSGPGASAPVSPNDIEVGSSANGGLLPPPLISASLSSSGNSLSVSLARRRLDRHDAGRVPLHRGHADIPGRGAIASVSSPAR